MSFTQQQDAVISVVRDEPDLSILVSARAGTGKTYTIEHAAKGIGPRHSTLAVAFNKRIATELAGRLPASFTCATLNSLGHRAWSAALGGKRLQLDADKVYANVQDMLKGMGISGEAAGETSSALLKLVREALSVGLVPIGAVGGKVGLVLDTVDAWESMAGRHLIDLSMDGLDLVDMARELLRVGIQQAWKGIVDFSDQIYMSALFGGRFQKFHTVIVDEAQDLSPLNHLMLKKMVETRLIAVGDPYQAIYGFRGADTESMATLQKEFGITRVLGLTESFRCSKAVAARQTRHVPDFSSHASCLDGSVTFWPARNDDSAPSDWSLHDIPIDGAVLCRNNAPLLALAFALIKERRPVNILGKDIGASLAYGIEKICGKSRRQTTEEGWTKVQLWFEEEKRKAGDKQTRLETLNDRFECYQVMFEASGKQTVMEVCEFVRDLFSDKAIGITLSSGHKAKGLEWHWVMHLDSFRLPSKQAQRAEAAGDPAPMQQEKNLRYVIETRTKDVLVIANLETLRERGEAA